jgi:hypothetical protein
MLGCSGFAHESSKGETPRSDDERCISRPSLPSLVPVVLGGTDVFESTDILSLLLSPFDLLTDEDEWFHCLNGATQQESARVGTAALSIRSERFVFWMKIMTPNDA